MANICLPVNLAQQFKERLKSKEIDPVAMASMTSEQRRQTLSFLGEQTAVEVNALFESKLLLKNQQQGMITWIKNVAGLKPELSRDIISRVNRLDQALLTPESEQAFLEDLAAQKVGVNVTMEEAGKISELAHEVAVREQARTHSEDDRLRYGRAVVAFNNYRNGLIAEAEGQTKSLRSDWNEFKQNPVGKALTVSRAVRFSFDLSYPLRQGMKALRANPTVWWRNSLKGLQAAKEGLKGGSLMDEVNADIFSRDNYGLYQKSKLGVGVQEEEIPSTTPEKLPVVGRGFKASNDAYTAQAHLTRADLFDFYYARHKELGYDVDSDEYLEGLGRYIGQKTGRARLPGQYESGANWLNKYIISPRFWASKIQTFTQPFTGAQSFGNMRTDAAKAIRREAAKDLVKYVATQVGIAVLASAILGKDSYEEDLRSADSGTIKVGNTRFDTTGGAKTIMTLVARLLTNKTKSSTTGILSDLGTGEFGSMSRWDVIINHFENQLAPTPSVIRDYFQGETFEGQAVTPKTMATGLFIPLNLENLYKNHDEEYAANLLLITIMDGLGASTNTYSYDANWSRSPSKELTQFREKVGVQKFKELNDEYNSRYNEWFTKLGSNEQFLELSEEDKTRALTNKKADIKKEIFKENNFKYKEEKSKKLPKL